MVGSESVRLIIIKTYPPWVFLIYFTFLFFHWLNGEELPNGTLFGSALGALFLPIGYVLKKGLSLTGNSDPAGLLEPPGRRPP